MKLRIAGGVLVFLLVCAIGAWGYIWGPEFWAQHGFFVGRALIVLAFATTATGLYWMAWYVWGPQGGES